MKFESQEELAHHLLDELLPVCKNHRERMLACLVAAKKSRELWYSHAVQ